MKRNSELSSILVFDIGGTKIACGILVGQGAIQCRSEITTRAEDGPETVFQRIVALGRATLNDFIDEPPKAVGVATAGQVDIETGTLAFVSSTLPGWAGFPMGARLAEALDLAVVVENDVNCFAVAEAMMGAGCGYRHLLLVAVGTGIGGGLIIDGQLYRGRAGGAGEIGHLLVVRQLGPSNAGYLAGRLEAYSASSAMLARSGFSSIQALAAAYKGGAEIPVVDEAADWLGYGLASLAHILAPEVILIGGSVGLLGERYVDTVRSAFQLYVLPSHCDIPIQATALGADSGLIGAGFLARQYIMRSPLSRKQQKR